MENHSKTFLVALTGIIGSGKTIVANQFKQLGVSVIDADEIAREIVSPPSEYLEEIKKEFGKNFLKEDGTLDRKNLRLLILKNPKARLFLEKLLHPKIYDLMLRRAQQASPYSILIIPLLFKSPPPFKIHRICVVDMPEHLRKTWLQRRDHLKEEEIDALTAIQTNATQQRQQADDVIQNDADLSVLSQQVMILHQKYLKLSRA